MKLCGRRRNFELDMDVQERLAKALNMTFERHGRPNRIAVASGRRKKRRQ